MLNLHLKIGQRFVRPHPADGERVEEHASNRQQYEFPTSAPFIGNILQNRILGFGVSGEMSNLHFENRPAFCAPSPRRWGLSLRGFASGR
jgi:hypothetical protein